MIVLSSDIAVKEVLDKRSGNYSDRPDMFIGQRIASGNMRLVVMVSVARLCLVIKIWMSISHQLLVPSSNDMLTILTQRYGEQWRSIHRMIHNILNMKAAVTYAPYQDLENKIMLRGFLDDPTNFHSHIRRYTFSLSTQLIFGHRCPDMNDPDLKELFVVSVPKQNRHVY